MIYIRNLIQNSPYTQNNYRGTIMLTKTLYTLSTVAAITLSSTSFAAQQILRITPEVQQTQSSQVQLHVSYDTSDANSVSGLGLRVHYPSKQLSYNAVSSVLQDSLQPIGKPQPDHADYDNDPNTDTYLVLAWLNLNSNWPGSTLPAALFQISFNITSQFSGHTAVNLSASSTASGYIFQSNSAQINQ